jgi:hypothetical protein
MISTGIYDSSVAWNLGQKNPGFKGLAAQRILEVLIFLADDYGRGRYIPGLVRTRAFSSTPELLDEITVENVENWLKQIEEEGTIKTYEVDGRQYYTLTGWRHYQRGSWRPGRSNIPLRRLGKKTTRHGGRNQETIRQISRLVNRRLSR